MTNTIVPLQVALFHVCVLQDVPRRLIENETLGQQCANKSELRISLLTSAEAARRLPVPPRSGPSLNKSLTQTTGNREEEPVLSLGAKRSATVAAMESCVPHGSAFARKPTDTLSLELFSWPLPQDKSRDLAAFFGDRAESILYIARVAAAGSQPKVVGQAARPPEALDGADPAS